MPVYVPVAKKIRLRRGPPTMVAGAVRSPSARVRPDFSYGNTLPPSPRRRPAAGSRSLGLHRRPQQSRAEGLRYSSTACLAFTVAYDCSEHGRGTGPASHAAAIGAAVVGFIPYPFPERWWCWRYRPCRRTFAQDYAVAYNDGGMLGGRRQGRGRAGRLRGMTTTAVKSFHGKEKSSDKEDWST